MRKIAYPTVYTLAAVLVVIQIAHSEETTLLKGRPLSWWISQLNSPNMGRQARAARTLSAAPESLRPTITEKLIPLLQADRHPVRGWAAMVLGNYGPVARKAVPYLVKMLKDMNFERNRAAAAKALGLILKDAKPSKEVDEVALALAAKFNEEYDAFSDVRREAVRAIGMIGPAAKIAIPKLERALKDYRKYSKEHQMVRQQAAWACGRMGKLAAMHINLLIAMLNQDGREVPEIPWAIGQIGPVNDSVVPNLINFIDTYLREVAWEPSVYAALEALAKCGKKAAPAVDFIVLNMKSNRFPSGRCLRAAIEVLLAVGEKAKPAVETVKRYADIKQLRLNHRNVPAEEVERIRKAARKLIEKFK